MRDWWSKNIGTVFFVSALVGHPILVFAFWSRTWDDSAITMAYARTFAHTGVIEATPGSGIVEGYSTTLWMLVLAALARAASNPSALLAAAKILSCLLGTLNIVLVRSVVRKWGRNTLAYITAGVFGLMELTLYESINAMEGPLMLTLMLTAVLCLPLKRRTHATIFKICCCLFVLARFEAILLIVPLLFFVGPWTRRLFILASWLTTLAAAELCGGDTSLRGYRTRLQLSVTFLIPR